jgi:glycosidase
MQGKVHPLVYEINTRCWLRSLSARSSHPVTLASVPESEFTRWRDLGFTHVWLLGVWPTGPRSRAAAMADPALRRALAETLPDWTEADFAGSPFAIADYTVAPELGGEAGLKEFRAKLHTHQLRLLLDFVPNHLGLDHPWVVEKPDLFVQAANDAPESFLAETRSGPRRLAHGKDPNFFAWVDTAQLDYRRLDTRSAMVRLLESVAPRCDGVRCDMAMLLVNEVFDRTWEKFPGSAPSSEGEFWAEAIQAVRKSQPDFLFLGEVYWDMEARLQGLGFDYTYDKRLYDYLVYRNHADVQRHLLALTPEFIAASAHFLENHDEARVASILSLPEHRAAALVTLALPGLRLLHDGQLDGARIKTPVHLAVRPAEPARPDIAAFYEDLLAALKPGPVGRGTAELLKPRVAWPDNATAQNFVAVQWQTAPDTFTLAVANLAPHRGQCFVPLTVKDLAKRNWVLKDRLGTEEHQRYGDDLQEQGLYLDLPEHGAQLFHFVPA